PPGGGGGVISSTPLSTTQGGVLLTAHPPALRGQPHQQHHRTHTRPHTQYSAAGGYGAGSTDPFAFLLIHSARSRSLLFSLSLFPSLYLSLSPSLSLTLP